MNFDDKTLKDTLCLAHASLVYDGVILQDTDIYKLGPSQVCTDALKATLATLSKNPDHSYDFLYQLSWDMESRGLAVNDKILLPEDEKNFESVFKNVSGEPGDGP